MHTRRLLFVSPRSRVRLAPVYVALLSLVALSLLGFVVAFWPEQPAASAYRPDDSEVATAGRSYEGASRLPPEAPEQRSRRNWM